MNPQNIKEIKKISRNFRTFASRLLKTNPNDGIMNLKKLLNYIETSNIIKNFIEKNSNEIFPIDDIVKAVQNSHDEYKIPEEPEREIAFVFQLLNYTSKNCEFYWYPISYAYGFKLQEQVDNFNDRVILPFINYITTFLDEILIDLEEEKFMVKNEMHFNGDNTQVNQSNDNGKIEAIQNNNFQDNNIDKILKTFLDHVNNIEFDDKEDTIEIIETAVEETSKEKPKKSIIKIAIDKINSLKNLASASLALGETGSQIIEFLNNFKN